ncbi:hypothetical protein [Coleofasciculus sp.]|uniref:hypothetical protein n=1 Tax=Coleofasciculus sp. TaxID=3100458 RepID=UPI0039F7F9BB
MGQFVPGVPQLRLFTNNAMAVQILSQIGLQNAWIGEFDRFGFNTVWVEALPTVDKANSSILLKPKIRILNSYRKIQFGRTCSLCKRIACIP